MPILKNHLQLGGSGRDPKLTLASVSKKKGLPLAQGHSNPLVQLQTII